MAGDPPGPKQRQQAAGARDPGADLSADQWDHASANMRKVADSEIMTRSEVAKLLRCSEPHVVALIEREELPAFRLGKLWRFTRSDVIAWCERRSNGRRIA
jgi:excisionase family DNA binding protein